MPEELGTVKVQVVFQAVDKRGNGRVVVSGRLVTDGKQDDVTSVCIDGAKSYGLIQLDPDVVYEMTLTPVGVLKL